MKTETKQPANLSTIRPDEIIDHGIEDWDGVDYGDRMLGLAIWVGLVFGIAMAILGYFISRKM